MLEVYPAFNQLLTFSLIQNQRFLGAEIGAFPASDTFTVIDDGSMKPVLRKRADGTHLDRGARVVLGTVFFDDIELFIHSFLLNFFYFCMERICLATCTPLADACESECVTPLPSPMTYSPLCRASRFSSVSTSIL